MAANAGIRLITEKQDALYNQIHKLNLLTKLAPVYEQTCADLFDEASVRIASATVIKHKRPWHKVKLLARAIAILLLRLLVLVLVLCKP